MILIVRVIPNSSRNEIIGWMGDALKIKIAAPPVDGKANKELLKFLAKNFQIPITSIRLVSGETSKKKKLELPDGIDLSF